MTAALQLQVEDLPEGCRLSCRGDLDLASADLLQASARVLMRRGVAFTIDLSGLDFVDSAGADALRFVHREAVGRAARVHVHTADGTVAARVLAIVEAAARRAEVPAPLAGFPQQPPPGRAAARPVCERRHRRRKR